jgi:N-acetylglucosamine-6-phosphate deacetylase
MRIHGNTPGGGLVEVEITGEKIAAVHALGPADPEKPFLSPGFVDIQINGFAGVDFSAPNLEPEQVVSVLPALWKTGVTTFYPTLITNTRERLLRNFRVLEQARRLDAKCARAIPGYHLEGPYLSPGPAHGAHDPSLMHAPDWDEFCTFQKAAGNRIRIVTLAPELPGALEFIRRVRAAGVLVALGHTDGTSENIHRAAEAGAELSVHLGNGCPEFIHRHRAPFWAQLSDDRLAASLICDGFHVPPELVQSILRVKGIDRLVLITDAIHVAGMPPGKYSLVGVPVELLPSGQVVREDRTAMAGSSVSLNRAVAVFMEYAGVSLAEAVRAATLNPARLLNSEGVCSAIGPQQPANIAMFHVEPEALRIEAVIAGSEQLHA